MAYHCSAALERQEALLLLLKLHELFMMGLLAANMSKSGLDLRSWDDVHVEASWVGVEVWRSGDRRERVTS